MGGMDLLEQFLMEFAELLAHFLGDFAGVQSRLEPPFQEVLKDLPAVQLPDRDGLDFLKIMNEHGLWLPILVEACLRDADIESFFLIFP